MGKKQCVAAPQGWGNGLGVQLGLVLIGYENHGEVSPVGSLGWCCHLETVGGHEVAAGRFLAQTDHHIDAGVLEVEGVGVALAAKTDHGNSAVGDQRRVGVLLVVHMCHCCECSSPCGDV